MGPCAHPFVRNDGFFGIGYILYHEMLHLKHPVKLRGSRRCVHSQEFLAEEKSFPELTNAKKFLRII